MRSGLLVATLGLLAGLSLTACDDGDPTDTDVDSGTETETETETEAYLGEFIDWDDKNTTQRKMFMSIVVFPEMKTKFVNQDSETWPDLDCETCHGENPEETDYLMPAVSPLDPNDMPQPGDGGNVDFMYASVMSSMVDLLKAEPFDPNTGEGFGCFSCHLTAK